MPIFTQRVRRDDQWRDDAHEAGIVERRAEARFELDELGRAPPGTQLLEAKAAVAHEVVLAALEGGVAGAGVDEQLVQHQRVGAELAQPL